MSRRRTRPRAAPIAAPQRAPRTIRACAALIVIVGAIAYANSHANPFVLDDRIAVVENAQIRTLWPLSIPLSPPDESPVARRPLVNLSFAVNYALGGLDVRGYHLGNLAIHLLAALVLFGLVRRTLTVGALAGRFGAHATALALASAVIWMLHPLQSEIVNYVSQRTSALMGLFYFLTLYCGLRGLEPSASRWRVAAILACGAGMASKETLVTAPLLVVLFDRTFAFGSLADAFRRRGSFYAALAATWILLAGLMMSGARSTVGFDAGVSAWTYFLNQLPILTDYVRLVFWPRALVVDYGLPEPLGLTDVLWAAAIVSMLLLATAIAWRLRPHAGFLCVAAFLTIAPTSSVVPIVTEVGAERRLYVPLAAITILVVCTFWQAGRALWRTIPHGGLHPRLGARLAAAAVVSIGALLATGTVLRNREYRSPVALARTTVERRPHGRAYFQLGNAVFQTGDRARAMGYFRRSAADDFPGARFALGTELLADGQFDGAVRQLEAFIQLTPEHPAVPSAWLAIATAHFAQGRTREALREVRRVLEAEPEQAGAHALLGQLLLAEGNAADAIAPLERALARQPNDVSALRSLGSALSISGDHSRAIQVLDRAVSLDPQDARTHERLGVALARLGRFTDAIAEFELALELDPDYAPARANLAAAQKIAGTRG